MPISIFASSRSFRPGRDKISGHRSPLTPALHCGAQRFRVEQTTRQNEVETLPSRAISINPFKTRDKQEVAEYAEATDLVFEAYADMRLTTNHRRRASLVRCLQD